MIKEATLQVGIKNVHVISSDALNQVKKKIRNAETNSKYETTKCRG